MDNKMNWFQKHLNWTVVLATAGAHMVAGITGIAPHWSITIMGLLATLALSFGVCSWALTEKNRSGWWLLLLFIPFGWIVFLNLENRSHIPKLTKNEYEREMEWAEFTALPEISDVKKPKQNKGKKK